MDNKMICSPDVMRTVASQILTDANTAIGDHHNAWHQMDAHLQTYPAILEGLLRSIIEPHQQRLQATYDWHITFANALADSANQIDLADQAAAKEFEL